MKKIFVAYSLEADYMQKLQERLGIITKVASKFDYITYIYLRDEQNWKPYSGDDDKILETCFEQIQNCDLLIADFTAYKNKNRTGLSIELGYAKACNKYICSVVKDEDRPRLLKDLSNCELSYSNYESLRLGLTNFFKQIPDY